MKLGFVSAILDQSSYEEMMDTASEMGFQCVEVACWPAGKAERRYAGVSHIDADAVLNDDAYAKHVLDYAKEKGCRLYGLTLNGKGVENAMKTGLEYVSFVLSVSEEHNLRNSKRTIEQSREMFRELVPKAEGLNISLALPCVFGSPFGDKIDMGLVKDIIEEAFDLGIKEIGLADTAGVSTPAHTREVLQNIKTYLDPSLTSIHLHDTRGMGLANAYVALEEGYASLDASLGGMGGCPFVPGAKGNIATEDLVNMCESMGIETGYNLDMVCKDALEMGDEIEAKVVSSLTAVCGHE